MEIIWPLVADDFVLCGGLEEDLRIFMGHFVEECRRRGLKVNANNRKVVVLSRKVGLGGILVVCLGCIRYHVCPKKVVSGRVVNTTRSLVNARILYETFLTRSILMYDSQTMI